MAKKSKSDWKPSENILKYLKSWEKIRSNRMTMVKEILLSDTDLTCLTFLKNTRRV